MDRDNLSWQLAPDNQAPRGWFLDVSEELRRAQDVLEFIPDIEAAQRIYRKLRCHNQSYELIGCALEDRVITYLSTRAPADVFGGAADPEEAQRILKVHERLAGRPPIPSNWETLGFDVAALGLGFYSLVFQELAGDGPVGRALPEYRRALNTSGLLPSAAMAADFLTAYLEQPGHEEGAFFVYQVIEPMLPQVMLLANQASSSL
ncbi:MAG: hypothetical protein HYV93_21135 [Candidatus Rokubacteria bacterium]|nr:hypothetical protein [Candidatus Rokubacteria bacterium]